MNDYNKIEVDSQILGRNYWSHREEGWVEGQDRGGIKRYKLQDIE